MYNVSVNLKYVKSKYSFLYITSEISIDSCCHLIIERAVMVGVYCSVCWLFIFKDTEPSLLQDSFSVRQQSRCTVLDSALGTALSPSLPLSLSPSLPRSLCFSLFYDRHDIDIGST